MDSDEVRKRKEYAERKVKERHAALRKEAEERRKNVVEHRERVQSQLKREQVLLQKRMQQLNEDEERKKATLAKQHEATSRIAAITKSPKSFAFGSSTPRTLAYLDNLPKSEQQYDKKLRPLEGSSPATTPTATSPTSKVHRLGATPQRAPPAAHRPAPTMTSMTSSMYVTSSAPPTRHSKTAIASKPAIATNSKRLSHGPSSMMTQSVYTPTSRPATSSRLSMGGKSNRLSTPTSGRPVPPAASTSSSVAGRRSMDVKKPPLPRKSVLNKPDVKKVTVAPETLNPLDAVASPEVAPIVEEVVEQQPAVDTITEESPAPEVSPAEQIGEEQNVSESVRASSPVKFEETPKEIEEEQVGQDTPLIAVEEVKAVEEASEQENNTTIPEVIVADVIDGAPEIEKTIEEEKEDKREEEVEIPASKPIEDCNEEESEQESVAHDVSATGSEEVHHSELISLAQEGTSESNAGSSVNTSLADELLHLSDEQSKSMEEAEPSKPEVNELKYEIPEEPKIPDVVAVNDLVDVFGNDFINGNPPPRHVFDEDTDSGKASPTSSETSSTTDEVTPRSVTEEVKAAAAPRVLPLVRSAEDIAKKEREARETEERRNRLAEILAKTRGMASPISASLPPTATIHKSGSASDVLARVAAKTNLPSLQKILQRKQGSNPSLQTSESTGGEIY